jgi:HEPN domain-containing protein
MINIETQINYWRDGADEAWEVGADLVERGKTLYGLFFVHLAMEKMLKAHVCKQTQELAPKIHSLLRLAEIAMIGLTEEQKSTLNLVTIYCMEGRYPETFADPPSKERAKALAVNSREIYEWLKTLL